MTGPRQALALAALVLGAALAGCASDEPTPTSGEPVRPGSTVGGGVTSDPTTPTVAPPKPKSTSERWHFHDYWKGSPTITLLDANVSLNTTTGPDGLPAVGALVTLPPGVIVPAETGLLTINVTWDAAVPGGAINVTYRPADSQAFFGAGNATNGVPVFIFTTESNCDVPHRQESFWRFNLSAMPNGTPPGFPARDVRVNITATIGRPLFIDPPHVNWWQDRDVIPLVEAATGEVATAYSPAANLTLLGKPPAATPAPAPVRVGINEGRIVPEGAQSVVVVLNWTSPVPNAKLSLRYREANLPSEGPMQLALDGAGGRVFVLPVRPAMTDTTYSNRTTWEFEVRPEGGDAALFDGTFELNAWVARLAPDAAVAAITAPAGGAR